MLYEIPHSFQPTIKSAIEYAVCGDYKAVVITADMKDAYGYGRIVRDKTAILLKLLNRGMQAKAKKR